MNLTLPVAQFTYWLFVPSLYRSPQFKIKVKMLLFVYFCFQLWLLKPTIDATFSLTYKQIFNNYLLRFLTHPSIPSKPCMVVLTVCPTINRQSIDPRQGTLWTGCKWLIRQQRGFLLYITLTHIVKQSNNATYMFLNCGKRETMHHRGISFWFLFKFLFCWGNITGFPHCICRKAEYCWIWTYFLKDNVK